MNNKEKVLKYFFENPTTKIHLRKLARLIKLNPATIIKLTNELEKEKIITISKTSLTKELQSNIVSEIFIQCKIVFNLKSLYESKIVDYIKQILEPDCISIMGSYRRGEDIERSDIDLIIINGNNKPINLDKFEKILRRKIQPLRIKYSDISTEFYINLINGIVLDGFVENETI